VIPCFPPRPEFVEQLAAQLWGPQRYQNSAERTTESTSQYPQRSRTTRGGPRAVAANLVRPSQVVATRKITGRLHCSSDGNTIGSRPTTMNHVLNCSDEQFFVILKQALLMLRKQQLQRLHENRSAAPSQSSFSLPNCHDPRSFRWRDDLGQTVERTLVCCGLFVYWGDQTSMREAQPVKILRPTAATGICVMRSWPPSQREVS
jgi:hypothetical protein